MTTRRASPPKPARKNIGGRPRTRETPSVVVTTRLDEPVVEALDEWAAARNLKRSPAVAECVRREIKRSGRK